MADEPEGFLGRWSRRKRQARAGAPVDRSADAAADAAEAPGAAPAGPVTPTTDKDEGPPGDEDLETLIARLPKIEELTDKSDFRPFMDPRIPDALRNRALRKLWRSNPVFANLDGLNDYDEDYTDAAMVVPGLKTAYQVGRGLVRKALDGATAGEIASPEAENGAVAASAPDAEASTGDETPSPADDEATKGPGTGRNKVS